MVHHAQLPHVESALGERFTTFVHRTVRVLRLDGRIVRRDVPTVSGLIFVFGCLPEVKLFLRDRFPGLHLACNCSTGRTAVIPESVMRPFMALMRLDPTRVRFLLKPYSQYAKGNPLLRITSGPLKGMEGHLVRISRDRRLVISVGDMTVAVGGVHKETFENLDEYEAECGTCLSPDLSQPRRLSR